MDYYSKYLKYKNKYLELKNQIAGAIIAPGIYFLFYNNELGHTFLDDKTFNNTMPSFSELNKNLGDNLYSLKNGSSVAISAPYENIAVRTIIGKINIKSFIKKHKDKIKARLKMSEEQFEKAISKSISVIVDPVTINSKIVRFKTYNLRSEDEHFFTKNKELFKKILNKINSENNINLDSVLILDVGVRNNFYITHEHLNLQSGGNDDRLDSDPNVNTQQGGLVVALDALSKFSKSDKRGRQRMLEDGKKLFKDGISYGKKVVKHKLKEVKDDKNKIVKSDNIAEDKIIELIVRFINKII